MRNPKWHHDEVILALDLYFDPNRGSIDDKNPKIILLSSILNQLPVVQNRPDPERFRNANGVTLKLSNFLAIDPTYSGKGMKGGSKLDQELFEKFYQQRDKLRNLAGQIKTFLSNPKDTISADNEVPENENAMEGQLIYRLHRLRERSTKLIKQKKSKVLKKTGRLQCEVCGFDFYDTYGQVGLGFIECHHRVPLADIVDERETKLEDLALVCSNCHRMLHRNLLTTTIEQLKASLQMRLVHR